MPLWTIATLARAMRMRVRLRGLAVRGPARVAEPERAPRAPRSRSCASRFESLPTARRITSSSPVPDRDARGVVAAVLEAAQAVDEHLVDARASDRRSRRFRTCGSPLCCYLPSARFGLRGRARRLPQPSTLLLPTRRDGDRVRRHRLRDRGARSHEGAGLEHERRDQVRVAADANALADRGAVLLLPVVVHRDRAAAEARVGADVGVADVRQVVRLHAGPEVAVLHLDEVPDADAAAQARARPQVRRGADDDVVLEHARLDHAVRLHVDAFADARRAGDHARPGRSASRGRSRRRVSIQTAAGSTNVTPAAMRRFDVAPVLHRRGARQLGAVVHAERLVRVVEAERLDGEPPRARDRDHVGEVELAPARSAASSSSSALASSSASTR